jgi:hypothetical protein
MVYSSNEKVVGNKRPNGGIMTQWEMLILIKFEVNFGDMHVYVFLPLNFCFNLSNNQKIKKEFGVKSIDCSDLLLSIGNIIVLTHL